MLTRIYIDNFRCFVNFEYRPGRKELLMGRNGTGKSSLVDALLFLRQFVVSGANFPDTLLLAQRTRWMNQPHQTIEVEASLEHGVYVYKLVLDEWGDPPKPRVVSESVSLGGRPVFRFEAGEVHLYNDQFEDQVAFPFDWHRSALATVVARKDNRKLTAFKLWLSRLYCFRINPFSIGSRSDGEQLYPTVDLSNLASWYRHLSQANKKQDYALMEDLRESIDGFSYLSSDPAGENVRLLAAEFTAPLGKTSKFYISELSDGQRCLVCLYAILHFVVADGSTVLLDEPENFIALRELQPWLLAATEVLDRGIGQVLLVSHHPEFINQWAPEHGSVLTRERGGPVRVERFPSDSEELLTPSELMARGWES